METSEKDLIEKLRGLVAGRIGYVDPWNVTDAEQEIADRLGLPVFGTAPELWPLGFKSSGRRIMREAGVPVPCGSEDVRSVDDVVEAARDIRRVRPACTAVVVKHDDSGAGDGNADGFLAHGNLRRLGIFPRLPHHPSIKLTSPMTQF